MKTKKYRIYIGKTAALILPNKDIFEKDTLPLSIGIHLVKSKDLPVIPFGIPKEVVKFLKKNNITLAKTPSENKFKKIYASVQSPLVGTITDIYTDKKYIKDNFENGIFTMTIEEAVIYQKYFESHFILSPFDNSADVLLYINSNSKYPVIY